MIGLGLAMMTFGAIRGAWVLVTRWGFDEGNNGAMVNVAPMWCNGERGTHRKRYYAPAGRGADNAGL